jgi:hypothetical protein
MIATAARRLTKLAVCVTVLGGFTFAAFVNPVFVTLASAQSATGHDHSEGPRGGQIAQVGPYDAEIVLDDTEIRVYLMTHEDPPVPVMATGGDIVVLVSGGSKKITLSPDGDSLLGKPDFTIEEDVKAVIRVKTADGKTHAGKAELETD